MQEGIPCSFAVNVVIGCPRAGVLHRGGVERKDKSGPLRSPIASAFFADRALSGDFGLDGAELSAAHGTAARTHHEGAEEWRMKQTDRGYDAGERTHPSRDTLVRTAPR